MSTPQRRIQEDQLPETRVTEKGQTTIPRRIRHLLNIEPGTALRWELRGHLVILYPVAKDPVTASRGKLQGLGISLGDFLEQRHRR